MTLLAGVCIGALVVVVLALPWGRPLREFPPSGIDVPMPKVKPPRFETMEGYQPSDPGDVGHPPNCGSSITK